MKVFGHRGAAALAPENTLEAVDAALAAGADGFECDVRRTRDGRLVLMHDASVDRTTDGTGRVADLTLEQIRGLDGRGPFRAAPPRPRAAVPTVEEVLDRAAGRCTVILEVKGGPPGAGEGPVEETAAALASLLEGRSPRGLVVSSFSPAALAAVRRLRPGLATALLTGPGVDPASAVGAAREGGHGACHLPDARVDRAAVERAHAAGLEVVAWTVDVPARVRELSTLGADGVISDDPGRALAALRRGI